MRRLGSVIGVALALSASVASAQVVRSFNPDDLAPSGKGWGVPSKTPTKASGQAAAGTMTFHGGPVMTNAGGTDVYYIWYGPWGSNTAPTILTNLAQSIGGTPYFNINTTYYDSANRHVANAVNYLGSTSVTNYLGNALTDAQVKQVVSDAISGGLLPKNTNAIYFVLTPATVNETSGFCSQYCGWHDHGTIGGSDIKYSFVGNPDRCPSSCAAQTTSPNGNAGADGMASIISHELEEAVTDPDLNAWYDRRGNENADKCAWTFGSTSTLSNGAKYNMTFGGRNWYIQQNWVNSGAGFCAKSF